MISGRAETCAPRARYEARYEARYGARYTKVDWLGSQGVATEQGVCALSSGIVVDEDAIHSSWFEWLFRISSAVSLFIVFSFSVSNNRVIISQVLSGLKAAFLKKMKRRAICNLCYDMRGYKVG